MRAVMEVCMHSKDRPTAPKSKVAIVAEMLLVMLVAVESSMAVESPYSWSKLADLKQGRHLFATTHIGRGQVLITGGLVGGRGQLGGVATNSCEVLDVNAATSRVVMPMNIPRAEHSLLVHPVDSSVFVVGGVAEDGGVIESIERYDVQADKWTIVGTLVTPRRQQAAYWISPTEIMVVGGRYADLSSMNEAEVFNISTGTSRVVAAYPEEVNSASVLVGDRYSGIVIGGRAGGPNSARTRNGYRYRRATDTWELAGVRAESAARPTTLSLWDGRFLYSGGAVQESPYDASTNVWFGISLPSTMAGTMQTGRQWHSSAQVDRTRVIVGGGYTLDAKIVSSCDWIDLERPSVVPGPDLNIARAYCEFVSLPRSYDANGKVVLADVVCISGLGSNGTNTPVVEILRRECVTDVEIGLADLSLVGSATAVDNGIQLTAATAFERSAVWYRRSMDVVNGFTTYFAVQLSEGTDSNQRDGYDPGADGFAFVLQNRSLAAIGDAGQGIGYSGIPGALAIEFDAYRNDGFYDPNGNHLSIQRPVSGILTASHRQEYVVATRSDIPALAADRSTYHCWIQYKNGILTVWMSNNGPKGEPLLSMPINFADALGQGSSGRAWMGITSSTGYARQRHTLRHWIVTDCSDSLPVSVLDNAGVTSNSIHAAPLPASSDVTITLPGGWVDHTAMIQVIAMDGRIVRELTVQPGQFTVPLSVAELPPAMYVLRVISPHGTHTMRLPVVR